MPRTTTLRKKAIKANDTPEKITDATTLKKVIKGATEGTALNINDPEAIKAFEDIAQLANVVRKKGNIAKGKKKVIKKKRYLHIRGNQLPKMISKEAKINYIMGLDDEAFLEEFRMDSSSERFFEAVMNLMTIDFLFWPSNFEKTAIALANEEKLGFPNNVVGFIYGCHHFDLAVAPSYRREEHDMRVLKESHLGMNINNEYFSGEEYFVLGDGGYKAYNCLVPVKKTPMGEPMSRADEKKFNTYISIMRIKIEHAFGILKDRFYSLKSIPIKVKCLYDVRRVSQWIRVCVILNNFLMSQESDEVTIKLKAVWEHKELEEIERLQQVTTKRDLPATGQSEANEESSSLSPTTEAAPTTPAPAPASASASDGSSTSTLPNQLSFSLPVAASQPLPAASQLPASSAAVGTEGLAITIQAFKNAETLPTLWRIWFDGPPGFHPVCKLDSVYGVKNWRGASGGLSKFYQRRQKVIKRMEVFLSTANYTMTVIEMRELGY
ncbi:hypothetical protein FB192DRAFT_1441636 [Mucor lusitanicus]|uniref:DDE Tnp4 domain-containing protein n=1 Tax=Mucor circinelloides f. lusitanicus TaxID=29924 RepID=A0A8H4BQH2_MUCCL|nr:hypothetical protein FB192DRAFT_1441636 [Mucor lusitanicus]